MKFNVVVDVMESDIEEAMDLNNCTQQDAINQISNTIYMGLSCIDAILFRTMGIECTDSYVEKS
jgi:hypothetical protein